MSLDHHVELWNATDLVFELLVIAVVIAIFGQIMWFSILSIEKIFHFLKRNKIEDKVEEAPTKIESPTLLSQTTEKLNEVFKLDNESTPTTAGSVKPSWDVFVNAPYWHHSYYEPDHVCSIIDEEVERRLALILEDTLESPPKFQPRLPVCQEETSEAMQIEEQRPSFWILPKKLFFPCVRRTPLTKED